MKGKDPAYFEARRHITDERRPKDVRREYQRDRARIIHSAAFRRLQGKTQVMGVGEGDFHRTRLTHSIECAQIGSGLLEIIQNGQVPESLNGWMPDRDLIEAACFAHDLGHPPYGHGGEKALYAEMRECGGFEGNAQTLRIISRLEKYQARGRGINPTRRLVLAILKYPIPYGKFDITKYEAKPPKCYFEEERDVVAWALDGFSHEDRGLLLEQSVEGRAKHRSFDSYLMELADDIAYGIHDIEDIVARKLADREDIEEAIDSAFAAIGGSISNGTSIRAGDISQGLFAGSFGRKQTISRLVNLFVTNVRISSVIGFEHPLLAHSVNLPDQHQALLSALKRLSFKLVIGQAKVQQLEQRGQRIVADIFRAMLKDPNALIPGESWKDAEDDTCVARRVCDYVAGMTDAYAEKVYRRMFIPGFGSSSDEL
jgi:dGTPase